MNDPHDPNRTVDHSFAPADSLEAGLATGFVALRSGLGAQQPGPLMDAEGQSVLPALPGYRVLRELARGGMGRVLAALDLALVRDVALKVLLPGANAERFVRESKIRRCVGPGVGRVD
jgi:serine/threonine protein kinase